MINVTGVFWVFSVYQGIFRLFKCLLPSNLIWWVSTFNSFYRKTKRTPQVFVIQSLVIVSAGFNKWNWALKTMTFSCSFKSRVITVLRKEQLPSVWRSCSETDPSDLLRPREAVLLQVIGQVQEGVSLQVLTVTEDDEETLLLKHQEHTDIK